MNHRRSLFLAFVFFSQADFLAMGQVYCENNGNYTANSTYSVNLNAALSSLYTNVDSNGFYHASAGQGIDRANAIVLCRGDVQLATCRECVQNATAELLKSCPNQKQAIRWDTNCTLRYSDDTIYGVLASSPSWFWWNTERVKSPDQFKKDLRMLIDYLRGQAANGGSLRKVAAGNVSGPDFQTIFALVQCTPDLSPEDCTSCLVAATTDIPDCCDGKIGGRVLMPSCNLRFQIYLFFNETRLQELHSVTAPVPTPVPAPVPVIVPEHVIKPPLPSPPGKDGGNTTRTVIIIVVSIVGCLILAVLAVIFLRGSKKQKPMENPETQIQSTSSHGEAVDEISTVESLQYTFSTIKAATSNFSDKKKLGQGGFGAVYKGKLANGREIAVKRLSRESGQGDQEFKNEVVLLAKLQHRNLVRLLGFALEGMERLLIYEFVQNASLDVFIFDQINRSYLNWDRRYKIITGIARGILYLHEDSRLRIIHRDLKASNVLLDEEMNPKIADFGMARLFGHDETQGNTSRVVGTHGYMSPEYLLHGLFSIKSDVFSFGVLVLELISGRRNASIRGADNVEDLLTFAWQNWRNGTSENVVDHFLLSDLGASESIGDILRCIHIGLLCVQENAADRPTMASVVLMLGSSSINLAVPSEPAFYYPGGYRLQGYNSRDPQHKSSFWLDQSAHSSRNDGSVTDLYPHTSLNDPSMNSMFPR